MREEAGGREKRTKGGEPHRVVIETEMTHQKNGYQDKVEGISVCFGNPSKAAL